MLKTVVLCALYTEAAPLIRKLNLKEERILKGFQTFCDPEKNIVLIISGSGKFRGAAACGAVVQNSAWDQLIVFSSSAGLKEQKAGDVYLIHKITDLETGMSYYPDLLYAGNLPEASLLSGDLPYGLHRKNRDIREPYDPEEYLKESVHAEYDLYDMDASGVVLTAEKYFGPHQITVLKTVTDHGSLTDRNAYLECMEAGLEKAFPYIESLICRPKHPSAAYPDLEKTAAEMHCSVTMHARLRQLFSYAEASDQDIRKILQNLHQDGKLPCESREEGKKVLNELARKLTA